MNETESLLSSVAGSTGRLVSTVSSGSDDGCRKTISGARKMTVKSEPSMWKDQETARSGSTTIAPKLTNIQMSAAAPERVKNPHPTRPQLRRERDGRDGDHPDDDDRAEPDVGAGWGAGEGVGSAADRR